MQDIELLPVDLAIAKKCISEPMSEDARFLVAVLSYAVRRGHLCLSVGEQIYPEEFEVVADRLRLGSNHFPKICSEVHREGNKFYFTRFWKAASRFFEDAKRLSESSPEVLIELKNINNEGLLPEQERAVRDASKQCLTIISGGPGTGKTYTAGRLIETLWNNLSTDQKKRFSFAFGAPTGKAAAALQKSLQRQIGGLIDFPPIRVRTLHSLLKDGEELVEDLILVDESSMIDVDRMALLFGSIKPGARLILMGDSHQLPPVETGALFNDLIHRYPVSELKTCLRAELKNIIDLAEAVHAGDATSAFKNMTLKTLKQDNLVDQALKERSFALPPDLTANRLYQALHDFALLTPLRKGPFGVEALNRIFYEKRDPFLPIPIMIIENDPKMALYNGDMGMLIGNKRVLFIDREKEGAIRQIAAPLLPAYELAYCLSVHKSQGSEFNRVMLVIPQGSEVFGREVLYTGITRARKKIEIYSEEALLKAMIQKQTKRYSGF